MPLSPISLYRLSCAGVGCSWSCIACSFLPSCSSAAPMVAVSPRRAPDDTGPGPAAKVLPQLVLGDDVVTSR
jgi:hypothetical protein